MMRIGLSLALVAGMVLSGCAGGSSDTPKSPLIAASSALIKTAKVRRAQRNAPPPQPIVVTRKLLDETPGEVMQVIPQRTGLQDFMILQARRKDATPGLVEVWKSSDNALMIMRDGVIVGTRGLGGDIRSAQVEAVRSGFDGRGGGGQRIITLDRLDGSAQAVPFSCDVTQLGREVIQIVDQRVSTYRLREDCDYNGNRITNEYWVETGTGRMRKSRQWAGQVLGYVALERLKN